MTGVILTLNAGSSSIKFALYGAGDTPVLEASGMVDAIGPEARLVLKPEGGDKSVTALGRTDHVTGVTAILTALDPLLSGRPVLGVGHRIVHGGPDIDGPRVLDTALLDHLATLQPLAPLHQPHNLAAVHAARAAFPDAIQVGAFDTAFHRGHPRVHDQFALPRRYYEQGVRRYGFHGLSYDYIAGLMARDAPDLARGKVIVAHLGNGASLAGIDNGRSISSTMGFSALEGLCMGTRPGQVDPGVLLYLMKEEGMGYEDLTRLLYKESGMLGLSGISHDMRELLASDAPEAEEAIAYYCARLAREIGAMAAVLGGLDALVFTGGVGENAAPIRARALEGLGFLGLSLDGERNARNARAIHSGKVPILVLPTDEEQVIARATLSCLG
ncbi:acetate/propionate family kinase [Nioella ostreopsis]|uniref:acetate/propionate family kinase n=1 Tax=Nioella ostreopsis TaxID=2448479 RepID=UPI000FDAC3BA|nr:acetate/propionate family kinase [Nioella ostreopsis]